MPEEYYAMRTFGKQAFLTMHFSLLQERHYFPRYRNAVRNTVQLKAILKSQLKVALHWRWGTKVDLYSMVGWLS